MSDQTQNSGLNDGPKPKPDGPGWRLNSSVVILCLSIVGGMAGLSYAAVPLYRLFCQITGYGGTTQKADSYEGEISDKVITVSFDSNLSKDLDWSFKPKQRKIEVRLGEKATAVYLAKNIGTGSSVGEATFNVSPQLAGQYFNKIECFCFTEQTLAPGETAEMPVLFFVDPEIVNDPLFTTLTTITLSYTMYPRKADEDAASLDNKASDRSPDKAIKLSKLQ